MYECHSAETISILDHFKDLEDPKAASGPSLKVGRCRWTLVLPPRLEAELPEEIGPSSMGVAVCLVIRGTDLTW